MHDTDSVSVRASYGGDSALSRTGGGAVYSMRGDTSSFVVDFNTVYDLDRATDTIPSAYIAHDPYPLSPSADRPAGTPFIPGAALAVVLILAIALWWRVRKAVRAEREDGGTEGEDGGE